MRKLAFISFLLVLSALSSSVLNAIPPQDTMPPETMAPHAKPTGPVGPLKITYNSASAEWTPATLAPLAHKTIEVYNAHTKTTQHYSGVRLSDLLSGLGVPSELHGKDLRLYLTAHGADGYFVVLSIMEVNPNLHPGDVLVADALEGKPMLESGPLQLIVSEDKHPARWVQNLVEIRVHTAE